MREEEKTVFEPDIPQVPIGWEVSPFLKVVAVVSDAGKRIKQRDYLLQGKIPVVDQGQNFIGGYTDDEDLAFDGILPVVLFGDHTRSIKFVDKRFAVGAEGIKILQPASCYDPKFFFYLLTSLQIPSRGYSRHFQFLKKFFLPLAPLNEQTRIVAEIEKQFSRLDEAVANLKRVKSNLKRYKAAVLKAAVEGKLTDRSRPFVKKSLGCLGKWCGGGTPSKSKVEYWKDGTVPWVSPKDMKVGLISDTEDHITEEAISGSATNLLPNGAVLVVTRSGILRHTLPVAVTARAVTINQDMKALQPFAEYNPDYVALALRANQQEILDQCTKEGTTVDSVEFPALLRYQIPIPSLAAQINIVAEVERRLSIVVDAEEQVDANLRRADRLRQSILKQAFSGQLVPQDPNDEPVSVLLERIRNGVGAIQESPSRVWHKQNRAIHESPLRKQRQPAEPKPATSDFASLDAVLTAILDRMEPGREYSRADLADALGLSAGRWNVAIQELKRRGQVWQEGEKRGTKYSLLQ